ncbi:hypothetical protein FOZ63_028372 [Perkinsus olseni]|uniref:Uncharacterized protein n=1 Tax=Perkinsus olseni TaxID=32597 RepID=A0A7J6TVV2_PEROL|nr:hypothetical protein FOZ63_028372 [Perkinsus olseni]
MVVMTKPISPPKGQAPEGNGDKAQEEVYEEDSGDCKEFVPPPSVTGSHQMRIPLIGAAVEGKLDVVERLLTNQQAKVDEKDFDRRTALMHAAARGRLDVVGVKGSQGVLKSLHATVEVLVRHGAKITAKDQLGETAIMKASRGGHVECIRLLLDTQLKRQRAASTGLTLAEMEEIHNFTLSEKRRILDVKDEEGQTALIKAAEAGRLESVRALVEMRASVDVQDDEGWNALMWASLGGHLPVVQWLVEEQLQDVNFASEKTSESPLIKVPFYYRDVLPHVVYRQAAVNGHVEICEYLLSKGAKINHHDYNYQNSLMWAAASGHLEVVEFLVDRGAQVNHQTRTGKTALMHASLYGHVDVCKFLLDRGAKVELEDEDGCTALFFAVGADEPELCELLISHGCSVEGRNQEGETPEMFAERVNSEKCVEVFKRHSKA